MPQSLARIYIHLVFSTKNRERFLPDDIRDDIHAYKLRVAKSAVTWSKGESSRSFLTPTSVIRLQ